jgi:hypothetical protein
MFATSRKVMGSVPDELIGFFKLPNLYRCAMAPRSVQPVTEMNTRNLPGGKGRPECNKADILKTTCEPNV